MNFIGMRIRSIRYARYKYGCFSFLFLELWAFDCFGFILLILCNFHSCNPHNSVKFLDMYQVKIICGAQASLIPLLLDFKLCPLFLLFRKVLYAP